MVFVPMAQAPPKAGANELLYSLNLIHGFTSLFSPKVISAGLPGKPSDGSRPLWTSVFFCGCASNGQDSPEAGPRAIFKWKSLIEPLKLLSQ